MTRIVNSFNFRHTIEPSFSWSPSSTYTFTAPNGTVIPSSRALINTSLTFTASVQIDNEPTGLVTVVEYHWDFGDGITAIGPSPTHTYIVPNLQARTVLRVTDNTGQQWFIRRQMYLG